MEKFKLILAVIYLLSPIDIIPEVFLGPFGLIDDGVALLYILNYVFSPKESKRVKNYEDISYLNNYESAPNFIKTNSSISKSDKSKNMIILLLILALIGVSILAFKDKT